MGFFDVAGTRWEDLAVDNRLIHMGHNCNQLEIHPAIHEAMIEAIRQDHYRNYTPPFGFEELREAIFSDVAVPGMEVIVTQGATEAIYQAMSTILQPGDETIVSDPAWPHIANFARMLGSEVRQIPVYPANSKHKLLPHIVREQIGPRTKLIAVIDPLNPLGSAYTEGEIKELCAIAEENDAYILHDATYRDFSRIGHYPAIQYSEHAVMNISLSKICGFAGLRVGATIAHPRFVARVAHKQVSRLGGNWVAQQGAIAAYRTKREWLPKVLEVTKRNQEIVIQAVRKVEGLDVLVEPSNGNFVAIDVTRTGYGVEPVVAAMLRQGIVIRSGHYTSDAFGNQFIRVTTSVPGEQADHFARALPKALEDISVSSQGAVTQVPKRGRQ